MRRRRNRKRELDGEEGRALGEKEEEQGKEGRAKRERRRRRRGIRGEEGRGDIGEGEIRKRSMEKE